MDIDVGFCSSIFKDKDDARKQYAFFDRVLQDKLGSDQLRIRQAITKDDFKIISESRRRLYGQRKRYYQSLFGSDGGIDEIGGAGLTFKIPERGDHSYCLYKGNILEKIKAYFDSDKDFDDLYKFYSEKHLNSYVA